MVNVVVHDIATQFNDCKNWIIPQAIVRMLNGAVRSCEKPIMHDLMANDNTYRP
ncbi:hypothetical protein PAXINDRAFT_172062, partial [Paxillus involutus ATCC 200175]